MLEVLHPTYIINITEFLKRAKSYEHLKKENGLLEDAPPPQELQKFINKIVSVFVVGKHTRKMCSSTKDTVIQSLISLGK